ncbi:hypothetical protein ACFXOI_26380 [Streptomyces bacillaris]|uniref:hypothetical protein n=1 Tax=Streptomyces bacillaris TaxID=68179 RepID=UPI0036C21C22
MPYLTSLQGEVLQDIELLEWHDNDAAEGMVAIGFVFRQGRATAFNAVDENGLSFTAPESEYACHSL